jgi:hypothetical protein
VVCDENGIGGSGEYCGKNDAHLGRIYLFYHEAMGGKCDAGNLVKPYARAKTGQKNTTKGLSTKSSDCPL